MREFLFHFARFGAVALVGYAMILAIGLVSPSWESNLIVRTTDFSGLNRRTAEWNERVAAGKATDLVFLGSSTCYSGIDPAALEAFGLEGFNLCSSGQRLEVTERLLPAVLAAGEPDVVVLDLYMIDQEVGFPVPMASPRDWIVNGGLGTGVLRDALLPIAGSTWDPFTMLLASYFQVRPRLVPLGSRAFADDKGEYVAKGYFKRTYAPLKALPERRQCAEAQAAQVRAVRRMGALCEAAGVDFILVHPPVIGCEAVTLPPELDGISTIDGNAWPGKVDFTNYYDDHHLLHDGAQAYSAWLAERIADQLR
jgi:hypothetical protein